MCDLISSQTTPNSVLPKVVQPVSVKVESEAVASSSSASLQATPPPGASKRRRERNVSAGGPPKKEIKKEEVEGREDVGLLPNSVEFVPAQACEAVVF